MVPLSDLQNQTKLGLVSGVSVEAVLIHVYLKVDSFWLNQQLTVNHFCYPATKYIYKQADAKY